MERRGARDLIRFPTQEANLHPLAEMILNAIRRWLWNRQRAIFHYHDGRKRLRIDPVWAMVQLADHPRYVAERHLNEAQEGDREAIEIVCEAAQDVFGVKPYDGRDGLTIAETLNLLAGFDDYLLTLKKSINHSPTPPLSTGATCDRSSGGTTSDSLGSGSAGTGKPPADPVKSEPESPPVSAAGLPPDGSLT